MNYYPYFRGRQFDLKALTNFATTNYAHITPIIEPVRDVAALPRTIEAYANRQHPIAVIQNPQVDHYNFQVHARYPIQHWFANPYVMRATILTPLVPPAQLRDNLVIVQHYDDLKLFVDHDWLPDSATPLVPPEARIRRLLGPRPFGHIFDHYVMPDHHDDVVNLTDSFFSEDLTFAQRYAELGFSDFLTQGHPYYEHGFPSRTVALHLIYLQDGQVRIHHFVSDQNEDFKHQKEKFFEALAKAVAWFGEQPAVNQTDAVIQLNELARTHHFPGMGVLKELTIEHHLTIMARYLANQT